MKAHAPDLSLQVVEMESVQLALNALPLEPSSRGKPIKRMSLFSAANV